MSQPKGYVDTEYLQVTAKVTEDIKRRSYELMGIQPGHKVLDVGCGPGTDTIILANLVGESGQVVGVDSDEVMIAEADRAAAEAGTGSRVVHSMAPNRRGSCRRRHRPAHSRSTWSCGRGTVAAGTRRRLPDMPRWIIRVPCANRIRMYLARRSTASTLLPRNSWSSSGTGQRRFGWRTTAPRIVRPTMWGATPRRVVSTSGSSGMLSPC